jgi:hypothetical protein
MNRSVLTINKDHKYRIAEVEFYFNDRNKHPDTFTHADTDQKSQATWYFHKFGKSYKSGTYKGLDLAFGQGDNAHGGILIRSIYSLADKDPDTAFLEGPCMVVNRILHHKSTPTRTITEVKEFVQFEKFSLGAFDKDSLLYLTDLEDEDKVSLGDYKEKVLRKGPRVGLTLKKFDELKPRFWLKDYRFCIYPELHSKQQCLFNLGLIRLGLPLDQIRKITGTKLTTLQSLASEFKKG